MQGVLKESFTTDAIANKIRLSINHPGPKKIWTVVESDEDVLFYSKCLNFGTFNIQNSSWQKDSDTNPSMSCDNVESIVKGVIASDEYFANFVIGIRDKDFTPFLHYEKPQNVFLTDSHSLETMILCVSDIQTSLDEKYPDFINKLSQSIGICKDLSVIRIHNSRTVSGISMEKALALSEIMNADNTLKSPWPETLLARFNSLDPKMPRPGKVATRVSVRTDITMDVFQHIKNEMSSFDQWSICQGHDTIRLLNKFSAFGKQKSSETLKEELIGLYTKEMFTKTALFQTIELWRRNRTVS